jgi:hypothetical protein
MFDLSDKSQHKQVQASSRPDDPVRDLSMNVEIHCEAAEHAGRRRWSSSSSLTGYSVKDLNWDLAIRTDAPPDIHAALDSPRSVLWRAELKKGFIRLTQRSSVKTAASSAHRKVYPPTYDV